jgi:hypothetical protein
MVSTTTLSYDHQKKEERQNTSTNHKKIVSYPDNDELVTSTVPPLQGVAALNYKSTLDSLMSYCAEVGRFLGEDSSGKIQNEESLVDLRHGVEKSILHVDPFRIWMVCTSTWYVPGTICTVCTFRSPDANEHKNTRCHEASSTVPDNDELVSSASPPLQNF